KRFRLIGGDCTRERALEQPLAFGIPQIARERRGMTMIGRRCTHRFEKIAALTVRRKIAAPRRRVLAGQRTELRNIGCEAVKRWVGRNSGFARQASMRS